MTRRKRNDHWLNTQLWKLPIGEWIGLILALGAIVSLLCILFIRRHTLEYHLEHTFAVSDQEFFGSALALSDPVPVESNAVEVLQNGDEYFPAMLEAIRTAKRPSTSRLTSFIRMKSAAPFATHCQNVRGQV